MSEISKISEISSIFISVPNLNICSLLRSYERSSDKWTKPAQFSKITRYVNHNKKTIFFSTHLKKQTQKE